MALGGAAARGTMIVSLCKDNFFSFIFHKNPNKIRPLFVCYTESTYFCLSLRDGVLLNRILTGAQPMVNALRVTLRLDNLVMPIHFIIAIQTI